MVAPLASIRTVTVAADRSPVPWVVILDVTGVKNIDESFASSLIAAVAALRLIGTRAILPGVRANVAQALVDLGVERRSIVTMSTLKSGVACALRERTGAAA